MGARRGGVHSFPPPLYPVAGGTWTEYYRSGANWGCSTLSMPGLPARLCGERGRREPIRTKRHEPPGLATGDTSRANGPRGRAGGVSGDSTSWVSSIVDDVAATLERLLSLGGGSSMAFGSAAPGSSPRRSSTRSATSSASCTTATTSRSSASAGPHSRCPLAHAEVARVEEAEGEPMSERRARTTRAVLGRSLGPFALACLPEAGRAGWLDAWSTRSSHEAV